MLIVAVPEVIVAVIELVHESTYNMEGINNNMGEEQHDCNVRVPRVRP